MKHRQSVLLDGKLCDTFDVSLMSRCIENPINSVSWKRPIKPIRTSSLLRSHAVRWHLSGLMTKSEKKIGLSAAGPWLRLAVTAAEPGTASIQSPVSVSEMSAYLIPRYTLCTVTAAESELYPSRPAHWTVKLHNRQPLYSTLSTLLLYSRETRLPLQRPAPPASPQTGVMDRWPPISFLTAASSRPADDATVMIRGDAATADAATPTQLPTSATTSRATTDLMHSLTAN